VGKSEWGRPGTWEGNKPIQSVLGKKVEKRGKKIEGCMEIDEET
jgi:hypothetical protein